LLEDVDRLRQGMDLDSRHANIGEARDGVRDLVERTGDRDAEPGRRPTSSTTAINACE